MIAAKPKIRPWVNKAELPWSICQEIQRDESLNSSASVQIVVVHKQQRHYWKIVQILNLFPYIDGSTKLLDILRKRRKRLRIKD